MIKENRILILLLISALFSVVSAQTIVLNEVMSNNQTTVADNYGEFDDWIEITNISQSDVHLAGYHLTDDISSPFKFSFPDSVIQPGEFIIVWADDDPSQGSMHANFKLSSSGEQLFLLYSSLLVDNVSFPALEEDASYGRWPEPSGEWISLSVPTPGEPNNPGSGSEPEEPEDVFRLSIPNPLSSLNCTVCILGKPGIARLDLFDISGRFVQTLYNDHVSSTEEFSWDFSALQTGVYLLRLTQDQNSFCQRITIVR